MYNIKVLKVIACLFVCSILSISLNSALADEFNYHNGSFSGNGIKGDYIDFRYNTVTKEFTIEAGFNDSSATLPNGFHFAVNDGPAPSGIGELAFIYFDATNLNDLKISGYSYNERGMTTCANNPGSWQYGDTGTGAPDQIFSTVGGIAENSDWVLEATVSDVNNAGVTKRTFRLVIDTTDLNQYDPLYGTAANWEGLRIGSKIGVWLWPVTGASSTYNTDGYLSSWTVQACKMVDYNGRTTNKSPVCDGLQINNNPVKVGDTANVTVTGLDEDGDDLLITYTGLPSGAVTTPAGGTTLSVDQNNQVDVKVDFTPGIAQAGQEFNIGVLFTQIYGTDQASVTCPFKLQVKENEKPVCDASGEATSTNLSCDELKTVVQLDGSSSYDPDSVPSALTYKWTTNCPNGSFDDDTSATPILTFDTLDAQNKPVACKAYLAVSDGNKGSDCETAVSVGPCEIDCLGQINGNAMYDICNVCDGDGKSCLDCKDVPNGTSVLDQCNVCDGDGQSCLECEDVDISATQKALDGTAKKQERQVIRVANKALKRLDKSKSVRFFTKRSNTKAHELQNRNWVLSWTMPSINTQCANTEFCVTVDTNQQTLDEYREGALKLKVLGRRSIRKLRRVLKKLGLSFKLTKQLTRKNNKLYNTAINLAATVPVSTTVCTGQAA